MCPPARASYGAGSRGCPVPGCVWGVWGGGFSVPATSRRAGAPEAPRAENSKEEEKRNPHGATTEANRRDQPAGQPPERKTCAALLLRQVLSRLVGSLNLSQVLLLQDLVRGLVQSLNRGAGTAPCGAVRIQG